VRSIKYQILLAICFVLFIFPTTVLASTLSLDPANGTFNKGCGFSLAVILDTQGAQTDGTDAILFFDASRFSASSIVNGTIYSDYPSSNPDNLNGKISISGLASVSSPFSGKGTLATINFTVLPAAATGASAITFDFDPNNKSKTTDSNVVERGTVVDTLSAVTNGSYVVGSGSCSGSTSTSTTVTPTPTGGSPTGTAVYLPQGQAYGATPSAGVTKTTLDQYVDRTGKGPGTPELTFTLAIVGSVLTILGILGLAVL